VVTILGPHFWTVLAMLTVAGAAATVVLTLLIDRVVTRWTSDRHREPARPAAEPLPPARAGRRVHPHRHLHAH
jgi:hypothetical protein